MLPHLVQEYWEATITNKLLAAAKFKKPWDQVTPLGTYITLLETLCGKCAETGEHINDRGMVLNITANAMQCPIFTQLNHEVYSDLGNHPQTCHSEGLLDQKIQSSYKVYAQPGRQQQV